jgi:hypothetical protein
MESRVKKIQTAGIYRDEIKYGVNESLYLKLLVFCYLV